MTQPGRIPLQVAARSLNVAESFYMLLAARGIVPGVDSDRSVNVVDLRRARMRAKWLRLLGEPLSEREVRRFTGHDLPLPRRGVFNMAGVNVAPLWRYLDEAWGVAA